MKKMVEPLASFRSVLEAALLLPLAMLAFTGCSDPSDAPLENTRRSPEALARSALEALEAGDEDRLAALMITREEYQEHLWPVLPDGEYTPFEFVWSITGPRSRKARRRAISRYEGVPMELVRVELGEDIEEYEPFTLYRGSRMVVRRGDTGAEGVVPLMDALIEMNGRWKFMNFVDGG